MLHGQADICAAIGAVSSALEGGSGLVFLSYATENRHVADAACRSLEGSGIACWMAPRDIRPGESWPAAITAAIERSGVMIVVLSSAATRSDDIAREIALAAEERIAILPYRIEDVALDGAYRYYLDSQHWLDAFPDPLSEQHLAELQRALRRSLKGETPRSVQSREPLARVPPPPPEMGGRVPAIVAAAGLLAGPLAALLSAPFRDQPEARGANSFGDIADARRRVAYYAVERGITWAILGAILLMALVWAARSRRPLLPWALAGAFMGGVGGLLGGVIYQGAKYLANPGVASSVHPPSELLARGLSYAVPGLLIGFTFARAATPLARSEGAVVGAAAGLVAGWLTVDRGLSEPLSLALVGAIVGGALAAAAVTAARGRRPY